jgi:hypothetical protein
MAKDPLFDRLVDAPDWVQNFYRIRLDVELRSVRAGEFQRLFDRLMRTVHGRDYRDTATMGMLGDQGCDGYLISQRTVYACYGPDPYFRLNNALVKLQSDLKRAVDQHRIPQFMERWVFVVNYPGTHPVLLNEALSAEVPGLTCGVWSRTDLLQAFMIGARRRPLIAEFGAIPRESRPIGRAYVVPESTRLPKRGAETAIRLIRARLRCDQSGYKSALADWSRSVAADPFGALVAQIQLLLAAVAAYSMAGYFDPEKLRVAPLLREAEISRATWRKSGMRAWALMMTVLHSVDPLLEDIDDCVAPHVDPIGDDFDKIIETVICANHLALGLVRMYARNSGRFETDCLDEVWDWMLTIPVMDDDTEHRRHTEQLRKHGLLAEPPFSSME